MRQGITLNALAHVSIGGRHLATQGRKAHVIEKVLDQHVAVAMPLLAKLRIDLTTEQAHAQPHDRVSHNHPGNVQAQPVSQSTTDHRILGE